MPFRKEETNRSNPTAFHDREGPPGGDQPPELRVRADAIYADPSGGRPFTEEMGHDIKKFNL
jgi:hypothetical protein